MLWGGNPSFNAERVVHTMTESEEKQQAKASSRNYPAYTTDVQIFPMAIGEYNVGNGHIAIPWKKNGTPWQCLKMPPPGFRAQAADVLPAPFGFPTPFRKARYQIKAGFAERCFFFCGISSRFGRDSTLLVKIVLFFKKSAAFLDRIRGPPSEI